MSETPYPRSYEEARALGWSHSKAWHERTPAHAKKYRARMAVKKAIARGDLVRPDTCGRCGGPPTDDRGIHAHHDDYDRPLDVRWLCQPCHAEHHKHMNRFVEAQRRKRRLQRRAA